LAILASKPPDPTRSGPGRRRNPSILGGGAALGAAGIVRADRDAPGARRDNPSRSVPTAGPGKVRHVDAAADGALIVWLDPTCDVINPRDAPPAQAAGRRVAWAKVQQASGL